MSNVNFHTHYIKDDFETFMLSRNLQYKQRNSLTLNSDRIQKATFITTSRQIHYKATCNSTLQLTSKYSYLFAVSGRSIQVSTTSIKRHRNDFTASVENLCPDHLTVIKFKQMFVFTSNEAKNGRLSSAIKISTCLV